MGTSARRRGTRRWIGSICTSWRRSMGCGGARGRGSYAPPQKLSETPCSDPDSEPDSDPAPDPAPLPSPPPRPYAVLMQPLIAPGAPVTRGRDAYLAENGFTVAAYD